MRLPLKRPTLSRQERLLAIGCALIVVVVVLDRMVITPWQRHGEALRREVRALESALASERRLMAMKDAVMAQEEQFRAFLRPAMEKDLQMAALFKEVEQLAKLSEVTLSGVKPLSALEDDLSQTYALEVTCECSLLQWVKFVYLIETSPSLFQIEEAIVEAKEDRSGLEGSLRLTAVAMRGVSASPETIPPPPA